MAEWRRLTLAEVCEEAAGGIQTGPFGSQLHASDYVRDGTPSVMPQNIGDNRILVDGIARVSDVDAERLNRYRLDEGDIVCSRRGDVERRALVRAENSGWLCGTGCLRVRIADQNVHDSEFISYALGLAESRRWITRHAVGATMLNLNTEIVGRVPLLVPSIREQRAIAGVLGALDDKIAANDRVARAATATARALFEALRAASTESVELRQLATTVLGGTPSRARSDYWDNGTVAWLASGKANEERVLQPTAWITDEALAESAAKVMPVRATVLAITGATLGQVARIEIVASGNQSLVGIWNEDPALNDWLYFAVRDSIPGLIRRATGAAQQHVNKGDVDALAIPMPDLEALQSWGKVVRPMLDLAASVDSQSLRMGSTRDDLLPLLMSGQVRVKEAEKRAEEVL